MTILLKGKSRIASLQQRTFRRHVEKSIGEHSNRETTAQLAGKLDKRGEID